MVDKLRKKFSLFAIFSVFIFLTLILVTINIVNFSLVASDADNITNTIKQNGGHYEAQREDMQPPEETSFIETSETSSVIVTNLVMYAGGQSGQGGPGGGGQGPMGPDSPETKDSLRYFTVSFDQNGNATMVEYKINYFSNEEAISLATSLVNKSTGWVKQTYRYRVWTANNDTVKYVTVIDQARELRPSYNVLYASLIGGGVGLIITIIAVHFLFKRFMRPIEEADNKQRRFIANASIALRTPISIMNLDNATLIKEHGNSEANKSINHELKKMLDLANDLNAFSLITSTKVVFEDINISNVTKEVISRYDSALKNNNREVEVNIEDDIIKAADVGMIQKMLSEIIENAAKYSEKHVEIKVFKENERIIMEFRNDSEGIPEGTLDRVFDRFYRLDYKDHSTYEGNGIGLAIVKDIVSKHSGRVIAKGENGEFVLKVEL
ncbi:MAG: HAMP domain-containing histidine kinase [Bacilli bacterium]|nr:HAMP domain-containing histidine kinase [Bacilli bacterium]